MLPYIGLISSCLTPVVLVRHCRFRRLSRSHLPSFVPLSLLILLLFLALTLSLYFLLCISIIPDSFRQRENRATDFLWPFSGDSLMLNRLSVYSSCVLSLAVSTDLVIGTRSAHLLFSSLHLPTCVCMSIYTRVHEWLLSYVYTFVCNARWSPFRHLARCLSRTNNNRSPTI